jgi:GrpB-like predicted nucleotidyltransferase (UPF0157 family)
MDGLERGIVRLAEYDANWPRLFEAEKRLIERALAPFAPRIEHVGSTSVPGLPSKPIIDVAIALDGLRDAEACVAPLALLGYEYKGENGVPGRLFFAKGAPRRTHHIHMVEAGGTLWRDYLHFRNYLRENPPATREYAALKRRLAGEFPADREAYTKAKEPFIRRVLDTARG